MIQPLSSHAHFCKHGHVTTNNKAKIDKCESLIESNKNEYLKDNKNVFYDEKREKYIKKCGATIKDSILLPKNLEFNQVYSRPIFDCMMKNQDMRLYFYEVQKNIANIHLALDEIGKKMNLSFRNAGKQRRKI